MKSDSLKIILDRYVDKYNNRDFIENDPISIPHCFEQKQDKEISGFFAAIFSWGQRKTIINKGMELMTRMDNAPYDFIVNHSSNDLKNLLNFKHRTFNTTDLLYCIEFLKQHFSTHDSLEDAFLEDILCKELSLKGCISHFHTYFFSLNEAPDRTKKHIPSPMKKSACKRICMFLRWMVRKDNKGVDFGIWDRIKPSDLIIPLDLHVMRTANLLSLLENDKADWSSADLLTQRMKMYDSDDPVKYDFAMFGMSIEKVI